MKKIRKYICYTKLFRCVIIFFLAISDVVVFITKMNLILLSTGFHTNTFFKGLSRDVTIINPGNHFKLSCHFLSPKTN